MVSNKFIEIERITLYTFADVDSLPKLGRSTRKTYKYHNIHLPVPTVINVRNIFCQKVRKIDTIKEKDIKKP